jgi:hypothetical protein
MVKPISSAHKYIERDQTDILSTQIYRKKEVTPISSTYKYIERGQTDILNAKSMCVLRISVLPLFMYLYVEDIGFTSFYDLCAEDIGFTSFYVFVLNTQTHKKR